MQNARTVHPTRLTATQRGRQITRLFSVCLAAAVFLVVSACDSRSPTASSENGAPNPDAAPFSQSAPADQPGATEIPGDRPSEPIPGQYLVVLDDRRVLAKTASDVRAIATELLGKSTNVKHTYSAAVRGFAAAGLTPNDAERLEVDPRVAFVEQDRTVHAAATQSDATWGLDRSDARSGIDGVYTYDATGQGVSVYVIDTGIRASHTDFGERAAPFFDVFADGRDGADCNGHGTHVAGTAGGSAYGLAKDASIYGVRVLDCRGSGTLSGVTAGIDYVAANHVKPAVANLSLGGGASSALDTAVQNLINAGVTTVVAAGNSNTDACTTSPARVSEAITVAASTSSDDRAYFSNHGSCVDLFAPGANITSAWINGDTSLNTISGTSMAAPHVAGTAALYLESQTTASPADVADALTSTATTGAIADVQGSPNRLLYAPLTTDDGGSGDDGGESDEPGGGDESPAPCTNCSVYTSSLSGTGDYDYQPNGTFYAGDATQIGYLRGPAGADYDLYLYKWGFFGWRLVASATGPDSGEDVTYDGSSGYFYWVVYAEDGSGAYEFYLE